MEKISWKNIISVIAPILGVVAPILYVLPLFAEYFDRFSGRYSRSTQPALDLLVMALALLMSLANIWVFARVVKKRSTPLIIPAITLALIFILLFFTFSSGYRPELP